MRIRVAALGDAELDVLRALLLHRRVAVDDRLGDRLVRGDRLGLRVDRGAGRARVRLGAIALLQHALVAAADRDRAVVVRAEAAARRLLAVVVLVAVDLELAPGLHRDLILRDRDAVGLLLGARRVALVLRGDGGARRGR